MQAASMQLSTKKVAVGGRRNKSPKQLQGTAMFITWRQPEYAQKNEKRQIASISPKLRKRGTISANAVADSSATTPIPATPAQSRGTS